jgi:hypothetical protein
MMNMARPQYTSQNRKYRFVRRSHLRPIQIFFLKQ